MIDLTHSTSEAESSAVEKLSREEQAPNGHQEKEPLSHAQ